MYERLKDWNLVEMRKIAADHSRNTTAYHLRKLHYFQKTCNYA